MRYITENPPMSKALPLLACAAVFLSQHALAGPFLEPDVEVIHTLTPDPAQLEQWVEHIIPHVRFPDEGSE